MRDPLTVRTIGRTVVVGGWLLVLAVAGEPLGLAVSLAAALAMVWASPYVLHTDRRPGRRADEASVTVCREEPTGSVGGREGE